MRLVLPRRRLLQALAAAPVIAACTSASDAPAAPTADDRLRGAAVERERVLLALYDAAAAGSGPADAAVLQAVREEHAEHLAALLGSPSPSATPSASPAPPPSRPQLVAAERSAAAAHAEAAVTASPELAGLLAALAASEASHPVVLA